MGLPEMNQPDVLTERSHGPDVMVSYSSHDRAQVMQFVQRLRAAGVAAWIDQGGIDGAQKWGEEIVNAIDSCKTVILMISQRSMQSENINKEVMLAWENGKHFLPLCLEDAKIPKSMQYQLAGIQQIKLYEGDPEAKFVAVLRALVRLGVSVSPYSIALVSADLGEREQAFEWLNKACEQRSSGLSRLKTEARFNILRGDSRFADLLRRVESLKLDEEDSSAEMPSVRPQPVVVRPSVSSKPLPLWRRIAWPEIVNDRSARKAAAQGVWASVFLVGASIMAWLLTSSSGNSSVPGLVWNSPLVAVLFFGPIAFGVQKMGRPAAVIGLALCSLGALGNLNKVQVSGGQLDNATRQYQPYQQYQTANPYLAQLQSQYYYDWISLVISVVCAVAFTNATRGTFAYHVMVLTRVAQDKQDALSPEDLAALRQKVSGVFAKSKAAPAAPAPGRMQVPISMPSRVAPAAAPTVEKTLDRARVDAPVQLQPAIVQPGIAPSGVVPSISAPTQQLTQEDSAVAVAPVRQSFAGIIGVSGGVIYWPRVMAFLAANVAAGLAFALSRSLTSSLSVPLAYWVFEFGAAGVFTLAVVAAFRFTPNIWAALGAVAVVTTLAALPFYALLPSFAWSDLMYREQFQQFILLPFVNGFILLAALVWVVPRLQPMVLALWLAAMGTEIVTSLVANLLHALGAGEAPDAVLGGASVISALLRSLVFALALWGGLEYLRKQSAAVA
jgi:hypothetical protein